MIPDDVEKIIMTKEDYDRNVEQLLYNKIKAEQEIERLNKELEKYKKRCYDALMLIRENYGVLDKYGIDMLDDILNGK